MREKGQMHETPADLPNGQEDYESRDPYAVPQGMGYDGPTVLTILTVNILVWPQNRGRSFLIL